MEQYHFKPSNIFQDLNKRFAAIRGIELPVELAIVDWGCPKWSSGQYFLPNYIL
jgi:hypothetical protein